MGIRRVHLQGVQTRVKGGVGAEAEPWRLWEAQIWGVIEEPAGDS